MRNVIHNSRKQGRKCRRAKKTPKKYVKVILSNRAEKLQRIPALKKKLQTQTCQHDGDLGCYGSQSHLRELKVWQHEIILTFGKGYRAAL